MLDLSGYSPFQQRDRSGIIMAPKKESRGAGGSHECPLVSGPDTPVKRRSSRLQGEPSSAAVLPASGQPSSNTRSRKVAATSVSANTPAVPKARARKASGAGPSTRAPKRRKLTIAGTGEDGELRETSFIRSPSAATKQRIDRAFQHRMYLVDKKLIGDENDPLSCEFYILGSTGNIYTVLLKQRPTCTCPDFPRSGLCKHMLFVMLRVLRLDASDYRVWQTSLLSSELKELLRTAVVSDGARASLAVQEAFHNIHKVEGTDGEPEQAIQQREVTGDCPICYEAMVAGKAKEAVVFCRNCGNNVHKDCFEKWNKSKRSTGARVTCIYCRGLWFEDKAPRSKGAVSGYINLANESEAHRDMDDSLEALYPETHRWIRYHSMRR